MTGKQRAFVDAYLGKTNFNATAAAKLVYKANSQHSFEEIGGQNLRKPEIRAAIESYWQASKMTRDEVLAELARLAKSRDHKDQVKALALLSQHFGLLNGGGTAEEIQRQAEQMADQRLNEAISELESDVKKYDREKDQMWKAVVAKYEHSPIAVEALHFLRDVMAGKQSVESQPKAAAPKPKPEPEFEIIPPSRRLHPAPAERMLDEVIDIKPEVPPEPEPPPPCNHGYNSSDCYVCDHIAATQRAWFGQAETHPE